jgi:hypothetical protein
MNSSENESPLSAPSLTSRSTKLLPHLDHCFLEALSAIIFLVKA